MSKRRKTSKNNRIYEESSREPKTSSSNEIPEAQVKDVVVRELRPEDFLKQVKAQNAAPSSPDTEKHSKEESKAEELPKGDVETSEEDGEEVDEATAKKRKRWSRVRITILVAEIIVLLLSLGALFVVSKIEKIHMINIQEQELQENMTESVTIDAEEGTMKGYTNIALFGVDTRQNELAKDTRSDTIIIASINNDTGEIKLVSVYRDTYLNVGSDSYNKCNSAYAIGGPEQAINMLNANLDLNITDFLTVGFSGLIDAIDDLGGIELDIQPEEISYLNDYAKTMAKQQDREYVPITESGTQHVSGLQATAYCRIRYTTGDDFRRAERQRTVLNKVFEKAKSANLSVLSAVADDVFDEVYTSMELSEIISYLSKIASYSIVDQDGFPQADMRSTGTVGRKGSCVIPQTLETNVAWLHGYLFEDDSYVPSGTVREYSERIAADTSGRSASYSSGTTTDTEEETGEEAAVDIAGYGYTFDEEGNIILVPLPGTEDTAEEASDAASTGAGTTDVTDTDTTVDGTILDGTDTTIIDGTVDPTLGTVDAATGSEMLEGSTDAVTTDGTVTDPATIVTPETGTVVTDATGTIIIQ